jgi:outer membrane protein TolC
VLLAVGATGVFSQTLPVVRIAVVVDGPWVENEPVLQMFEGEILELTEGEFDVRFPEEFSVVGDWTIEGVRGHLDRLLADPDVDLIITLGVLASHDVALRRPSSKPVIAPIVIDAELQGLPNEHGTSGVENLNYLVFPNNLRRDMEAFLDVVRFKKVAVLFNKNVHATISGMRQRSRDMLADLDIEPVWIPVGESIDETLALLTPDIDAIYAARLLHLAPSEFDRLVTELNTRKLPTFSLLGDYGLKRGMLACLNVEIFPRLSRRVALNVQRILLGENAGTLPTVFPGGEQLTINMATARAIGVFPSWGVMTEARLINDTRRDIERVLSIEKAVDEAIERNLILATAQQAVAAAAEDIALARSELWPQIDLSLLGLQIDRDRASQSAGQQSEQTLTGLVSLSEILYAEPAWANLTVQKRLQNSREYDRDALKLDIAQETATAYLDVLRAKTFERIQKENLRRTRSNLDLARVRESIGVAGPAEVLRWQSELADNRKTVIDANAARNVTEIALNRLLQRPEEEPFLISEVDLNDPNLLLSQGRLLEYMGNQWDFRVLRTFMVKEGIESAPEISALKEAIAAQQRAATSAGRSFWLPSFVLVADLAYVFAREGTGSDFDTGVIPPELAPVFGSPEDLSWSIGLSANYAIEGGAKIARRQQAVKSLQELRLRLSSTSELVEERIRSAMHTTGASYAGIEQSRLSADAAEQSRVLVEDAYARGAATILDLLDAQNNALIAELTAANAVYQFLIDLMEVERSIGKLVLRMSEREREAFFDRMDSFFVESGQSR